MFWIIYYFILNKSKIKLVKKDIKFNFYKVKEICFLGSFVFVI